MGFSSVHVRGVTKSFSGPQILKGVDLDVRAGKIVALLGPSGCGKTTLLRCVAGLERPDEGAISVGEAPLCDADTFVAPERRGIGMIFQDWALFPHLSVGRNVAFGLPRGERRDRRRIDETLEMVDLAGYADRSPATLSGGQQQRVAIARALANHPAVILLDEPFSNLDASLRTQIRSEVIRLLRDLGLTALFVTHQQEEAFVVGDEVAVMLDGTVHQQAAPASLYDAPRTRAVAEFIGDANFLPGTARGTVAETPIGLVPLVSPTDGAVEVMMRPEYVTVSPGQGAVVEQVEFYGHDAVYLVRPEGLPPIRARVLAAPDHRPGDRVSLAWSGRPAVAFPLL